MSRTKQAHSRGNIHVRPSMIPLPAIRLFIVGGGTRGTVMCWLPRPYTISAGAVREPTDDTSSFSCISSMLASNSVSWIHDASCDWPPRMLAPGDRVDRIDESPSKSPLKLPYSPPEVCGRGNGIRNPLRMTSPEPHVGASLGSNFLCS
jgi:hypothetical protein